MEAQHYNCNCCKVSPITNTICSSLSDSPQDPIHNNLCTATHNYPTFSPINQTQKCILSYFSNFYFSGELRNRYWHHRWRRRLATFPCHRCEILMEEEFPHVSLCLSTGALKNPSLQEDLVKLSFLTVMTLALVIASVFISNWFVFGACMTSSFILLILPFLVNLFYQLPFKEPMLVIKTCVNNARSSWNCLVMFLDISIKYVINLHYIVKKKVVVEPVSCGVITTTNNFKRCGKQTRLCSKSSTSSVVLLWYTALLALSQSPGKISCYICYYNINELEVSSHLSWFIVKRRLLYKLKFAKFSYIKGNYRNSGLHGPNYYSNLLVRYWLYWKNAKSCVYDNVCWCIETALCISFYYLCFCSHI